MMTSSLAESTADGPLPAIPIIAGSGAGSAWASPGRGAGSAAAAGPPGAGAGGAGRAVADAGDQAVLGLDLSALMRCPPVAAGPLSDTAAMEVALRLKVLGYPVRVKLMSLLFGSPAGQECGRVLAAAVGLPETTVSRHLQQLRLAGLIESQRRGMHVFHRPHRVALNALCTALDPNVAESEEKSAADGRCGAIGDGGRAESIDATSVVSFEGHAARARLHLQTHGRDSDNTPVRRTSRPRFRSA
jgi:ArsR family transcriptional regulator, arsenate/arsenite/antimonite-responsive transcriptional repressor